MAITMRVDSGFTYENGIVKNVFLDKIPFIKHGFTTRLGGVSRDCYSSCNLGLHTEDEHKNVLSNYDIVAKKIGFDAKRLVLTHQVHSDRVRIVTETDAGKGLNRSSDLLETDGIITACRNLPIGVFTADCTPVLLVDMQKRVVAAIHSGWRGTLMEIAKKAVLMMKESFNSNPCDIVVAIGPSIKKCHFEVQEDVFSAFCDKFGKELVNGFAKRVGESFFIDTDSINRESLLSCGILKENIHICPMCTYCESDKFFSHRQSGGKTGRQCAFIMLR